MPTVRPRTRPLYSDPDPVETPPEPTVVHTFTFFVSCPADGGELLHLAAGRPNGGQAAAMVRCTTCRRPFLVRAVIEATDGRAART